MAIAFVSGSSGQNFTSSLVITAPTSISSGNVLVAGFYIQNTFTVSSTGWTVFMDQPGSNYFAIATKVAGGSEPGSYTFTFSGTTNVAGVVLNYSGASGLDGNPTFGGFASGTTGTAPSITPGTGNAGDMWVAFFGENGSATSASTPTGFTARTAINSSNGYWTFEKQLASSSATGTASTTFGSSTFYTSGSALLLPGTVASYAPPGPPPSRPPIWRPSLWRGWTKKLSGLEVPAFADQRLVLAGA